MPTDDTIYAFGSFALNVSARSLSIDGKPVALGSRSFEILVALVQRRGEVVSKEDLLARAWPNIHVEEHNLKVHVSALRRALGKDGRGLVINIPGRGYSFVGALVQNHPVRAAAVELERPAGPLPRDQPADPPRKSGRRVQKAPTCRIGIVHSLTGPMAQSEGPISEAALLAIHEINQAGGISGRLIEPLVVDCESDETCFSERSEELIAKQEVAALFGCLTSASRKRVKAVVERHDHLLLYPMQYEGLEQSPNIFYLGAAPNQQLLPAVQWTFAFLRRRRFFLVGWDSIYSRASNAILRDEIESLGGIVVGEEYIHVAGIEIRSVVQKIAEIDADIILNSVVGDVNAPFCRALRGKGIRPPDIPTVYFSISENELRGIPRSDAAGDYGVSSYFQTLDRAENRAFVSSFRSRYGDQRVTSDPMESSYSGVHLWSQAMRKAGARADVSAVRKALCGQTFNAPGGPVTIEAISQHTWKTVRIAQITKSGDFSVIWSSEKPIRPEPYPPSRSVAEWQNFLNSMFIRWQGHWSRPSPL